MGLPKRSTEREKGIAGREKERGGEGGGQEERVKAIILKGETEIFANV